MTELNPIASQVGAGRLGFVDVYDAWFRQVFRWVRAHGCPAADVEDLTQEIFIVVQRRLSDFDGENLPGWLYRITARTVRDHRRSAWFRNLFSRRRDLEMDELGGHGQSAPELLEQKEDCLAVYDMVAKMNPKWRAAFFLFEIEEMSGEEIATLEGIPLATLWTHLHRARKEFAALVAERQRRQVL